MFRFLWKINRTPTKRPAVWWGTLKGHRLWLFISSVKVERRWTHEFMTGWTVWVITAEIKELQHENFLKGLCAYMWNKDPLWPQSLRGSRQWTLTRLLEDCLSILPPVVIQHTRRATTMMRLWHLHTRLTWKYKDMTPPRPVPPPSSHAHTNKALCTQSHGYQFYPASSCFHQC